MIITARKVIRWTFMVTSVFSVIYIGLGLLGIIKDIDYLMYGLMLFPQIMAILAIDKDSKNEW